MTSERKKQLELTMLAYARQQGNIMQDAPKKVLQEITDDVCKAIEPYSKMLLPMYIAAFEFIAQSLRAHFSDASELADDLKRGMTYYSVAIPNRKNK